MSQPSLAAEFGVSFGAQFDEDSENESTLLDLSQLPSPRKRPSLGRSPLAKKARHSAAPLIAFDTPKLFANSKPSSPRKLSLLDEPNTPAVHVDEPEVEPTPEVATTPAKDEEVGSMRSSTTSLGVSEPLASMNIFELMVEPVREAEPASPRRPGPLASPIRLVSAPSRLQNSPSPYKITVPSPFKLSVGASPLKLSAGRSPTKHEPPASPTRQLSSSIGPIRTTHAMTETASSLAKRRPPVLKSPAKPSLYRSPQRPVPYQSPHRSVSQPLPRQIGGNTASRSLSTSLRASQQSRLPKPAAPPARPSSRPAIHIAPQLPTAGPSVVRGPPAAPHPRAASAPNPFAFATGRAPTPTLPPASPSRGVPASPEQIARAASTIMPQPSKPNGLAASPDAIRRAADRIFGSSASLTQSLPAPASPSKMLFKPTASPQRSFSLSVPPEPMVYRSPLRSPAPVRSLTPPLEPEAGPSRRKTRSSGEGAAPEPVVAVKEKPTMSAAQLQQLTNRNTARNRAHFNRHETIVVHMDGPRPPSPTAKLRRTDGTDKASRNDRAKKRLALKSGFEANIGGTGQNKDESMEVDGAKRPHFQAPGDEGVFESPVKKGRVDDAKTVKFDRSLVKPNETKHAPVKRKASALKSTLAKSASLDANGNAPNAAVTLSPIVSREDVRIVKQVYQGED